ncbi:MAG: RHS repeat protein [Cytophagales bacterium]|nr:RHS repeat protein [Cytophagales bacterium]
MIIKTDPNGSVITYEYDLYDRLIKEINPKETYVLFEYNKDGTIRSKEVYDSLDIILTKTDYFYDGLGNVIHEIKYTDPVLETGLIEQKFEYDKNGQVIKIIDAKGNSTTKSYDSHGRETETVDVLGNQVRNSFDNRDLVVSQSIIPNTGT